MTFRRARFVFALLLIGGAAIWWGFAARERGRVESQEEFADSLFLQGKLPEAEQEYRTLIAVKERMFGAEHDETVASREMLWVILRRRDLEGDAMKEWEAIFAIKERVYGPGHGESFVSKRGPILQMLRADQAQEVSILLDDARERVRKIFRKKHKE